MKQFVKFGCLATVAVGLSGVSLSADVVFPNADAKGDLSSTASWGQDPIPDATSRVRFNASLTATALNDIDFAGLYLPNANTAVTLDMRDATTGGNPRQINLTAPIDMATQDQSLKIRGGRWNLNNQSLSLNKSYGSTEARKYVTFSDGAVVENASSLVTSYSTGGSGFRFEGVGTSVSCKKLQTYYDGSNGKIEIVDGASVVVTGTDDASLRFGYNNGHDNLLVVSNGASLTSVSSVAELNTGNRNNAIRILAGGTATITGGWGTKLATVATTNSLVEVDGEGSSLTLGAVYFGKKDVGCSNNLIRVTNGGLLTYGQIWWYGLNNGIVISNATVKATTMAFSYEAGTDATAPFLRMQGARALFVQTATTDLNATLKAGFRFIFEIPPEGYDLPDGSVAPITFSKWVYSDRTWDIEIARESLVTALAKMSADGVRTRKYKLINFKGGVDDPGIPAAQVERWRSELPTDLPPNTTATLALEAGIPTLTLTVKKGMVLLFR